MENEYDIKTIKGVTYKFKKEIDFDTALDFISKAPLMYRDDKSFENVMKGMVKTVLSSMCVEPKLDMSATSKLPPELAMYGANIATKIMRSSVFEDIFSIKTDDTEEVEEEPEEPEKK